LRRYQEILNIKQKRIDSNLNASFEFEYENWDTTFGAVGTFVTDAFAGRKAIKFTGTSALGVYQTKLFSTGAGQAIAGNDYQALFSVNIDQGGSDNRLPWYLRIEYTSGSYKYWAEDIKSWGTSGSIIWNEASVIGNGTFESFRFTAKNAPDDGQLQIGFALPYINATGSYDAMYLDNCAIRNIDNEVNQYNEAYAIREQSGTFIASDILEHDGIYVANVGEIVFWGAFINYPSFKRAQDTTPKFIEEIVTQQRLNDFREYCKTYEGDLSSASQYLVLSMMNKVYFKFNTFTETDSAIMDNMKFMVKSDVYSINCHVPNNYTDVESTYRLSYQE
jgi:hypothetical protein